MTPRFLKSVSLVFAVAVAILCTSNAVAGNADGQLRVILVDAQDHTPVAFAEVDIYGPRSARGFTGPDGVVFFDTLPAGVYTIVQARAEYEKQILRSVRVAPYKTESVSMFLTHRPTDFHVIAQASARPRAPSNTVSADSPIATLKQSLVDAISLLPDATIVDPTLGSISIDGHPASESEISIDGVPVSPLGGTANLQSFNADLFSSVGIETGSAATSTAGDIAFKMREPTVEWLGNLGKILGSYDGSGFMFSEGGTVGRLGIAFSHGERAQGDNLNGRTFYDQSGLSYSHDTIISSDGDALKLRYPFSLNNVLTGTLASLNSNIPYVCKQYTAPVPCGYGPGNGLKDHLVAAQIKDSMYFERGDIALTLFHSGAKQVFDLSHFRTLGVLQPSMSTGQTSMAGEKLDASLAVSPKRSIEFQYLSSSQRTTSSGEAFGSILPPLASSLNYSKFFVSTPLFRTRTMNTTFALGRESTSFAASGAATVSTSWRISNTDSLSFNGALGSLGVAGGVFTSVSPPNALSFNCNDGYALGNGPSSSAPASHNTTVQAVWAHQGARVQSTLRAYREDVHDATISGVVNADALPLSLFDANYFGDVANRFASVCGSANGMSSADVFFRVSAPVSDVVYQGATALVRAQVSPNMVINAAYGKTVAVPHGSIGPLFSPMSTAISGHQLPSVPRDSFTLSAAAGIGGSDIIAMASMHVVSSNNPHALPTYALFDAGVTASMPSGALAITATNLFNAFPGPFETDDNAVPLPFRNGSFPTVALPLQPRTFYIGYRFRTGPRDIAGQKNSFSGESFFVRYYPLGSTPAASFLAPNTQSSACGPEDVSSAQAVMNFIKQFARDIEAARSASGYPSVMASRTYDGLSFVYRNNGPTDYAILIGPATGVASVKQNAARPLMSCGITHYGSAAEFQRLHLYLPTYDDSEFAFLGYAPRIGLFRLPELIATPRVMHFPSPTSAPLTDPFALKQSAACTSSIRPVAQAIMDIVSGYASQEFNGEKPVTPAELDITANGTGSAKWLQITDKHSHILRDVLPCLQITAIPKIELKKLGYGGLPWIQGLNYAPAFGLYVIK